MNWWLNLVELDIVGQVVGGNSAEILIREKADKELELGDLLISEEGNSKLLLQVFELAYGSQIPQLGRELMAGLTLERAGKDLSIFDSQMRNYVIASVKPVLHISGDDVLRPKTLPKFFSSLRLVNKDDLFFFEKPDNPIYLGKIRSGSKVLEVDIYLDGFNAFSHHIVIPATTGRGKSNLVKVILWDVLGSDNFGILVLDPHDEYYGRHSKGLKDHPAAKSNLIYYSSNPPTGANTLVINLKSIRHEHFQGLVEFTDAQEDAIKRYHTEYGSDWIEFIVRGEKIEGVKPVTLDVLRRKFDNILGIHIDDSGELQCRNKIFSTTAGLTTTKDIADALEQNKVVIVDTSKLLDEAELLIGSIVIRETFNRYQRYKSEGILKTKPVVAIVIEEAPRVLGKEVIESKGDNIYSTVAREGRKFQIGLIAITQLISLIPRQILANMNTKIVLGNEMAAERHAIIESASQDLSTENRSIASLDRGEAIITSNFTKFAVPIKIPLFEEFMTKSISNRSKNKTIFTG